MELSDKLEGGGFEAIQGNLLTLPTSLLHVEAQFQVEENRTWKDVSQADLDGVEKSEKVK